MRSTKNSRARCEMDTEFIPTVLDSLLLVDYRKNTEKSIGKAFWGQTVVSLYDAQKISLNYGIFLQNSTFSFIKMVKFKSLQNAGKPSRFDIKHL